MLQLLKSRGTWTGAAVIAVLAFFLAVGTNQIIRGVLVLPDDAEVPSVSPGGGKTTDDGDRPTLARTPEKPDYKDPIVKRSIFDSTKVGMETEDEGVEFDPSGGVVTDWDDLVLLATLVARNPGFSSALLADGSKSTAYGFAEGDELFGQAEIIRIEQRRVVFLRDGRTEYVEMSGDKKVAKSRKTSKKTDDEGITKEGDKIIVERSLVEDALANVESLATKIRVVPHKGSDGQVDGYRLSAIRRGSLFDKLGIKNGDVVHAVNGMPLTSMDGAMSAFQSLQSDDDFNFEVTRRNKKQTFEYEIR